jgi:hypothetical protein
MRTMAMIEDDELVMDAIDATHPVVAYGSLIEGAPPSYHTHPFLSPPDPPFLCHTPL